MRRTNRSGYPSKVEGRKEAVLPGDLDLKRRGVSAGGDLTGEWYLSGESDGRE